MTTEMITAIFAGLVLCINAVGLIIITVKNGKTAKKQDCKLDEIHTLVNGRLAKALTEITELRAHIEKFSFHEVKEGTVEKENAVELDKKKVHGAAQ